MRADVIFNAVGFKSPAQAPCPVFLFQNIEFGNIFPILLGGILPLYKITRKQHKTIIKLFNFIPICKKG